VDNELEVIRHQMEETRSSLADKLEVLEEQVRGTVEEATSAVSTTVEAVETAVQETVETVRDTFDLRKQVERHPWPLLAGAVAAGFLAGRMLLPARGPARSNWERAVPPPPAPPASAAPPPAPPAAAREEARPSSLAPVLEHLKGLAVGSLMGLARQLLTRVAPAALAPELTRVVDEMTTRLGGKVLDWSEAEEPEGGADREAAPPVEPSAARPASSAETSESPPPRPNGRTGKRRRARS
jgi:ElaB/YqjD/DUF883 family membrane-anchored ribosome-binding protein